MFKYTVTLLVTLLTSVLVNAQGISVTNISDSDFNGIVKDLSAVFMHNQAGPAGPLGAIFGFEVGAFYSSTGVSAIDKVNSSSSSSSTFPFVGVILGASFPMGITAELNYLPEMEVEGVKIDIMSMAGKWTLPDAFIPLPGTYAAKVFISTADLGYTDSSIATTVGYTSKVTGIQLIGGTHLGIVEPYFGLGYLMAEGDLKASTTSVFADNSLSKSSSPTSMQVVAGAELNLLMLALGLEYSNAFDTSKTTFKLSFQF